MNRKAARRIPLAVLAEDIQARPAQTGGMPLRIVETPRVHPRCERTPGHEARAEEL